MSLSMGIIGCQVLEDEMAYVISHDPEVMNVLVIDSTNERTLAPKIKRMAPEKKVTVRDENFDVSRFRHTKDLTVIAFVKSIAYHQDPHRLRGEVVRSIKKIEPYVGSVLLLYGQCGNAFMNMSKLTDEVSAPLTILKDAEGFLVDDCFGTVLGGRKEYRNFLIEEEVPAFILNGMWLAHWRQFMQETQMLRDPHDVNEVRDVFKYMDYRKVIGLSTGLVEGSIFEMLLEEFSEIFGLLPENHLCTLSVVERSYEEAKEVLLRS